jgi:hypothetical protein
MRPAQRFGLSAIEKREIWSRWKTGQSLHETGTGQVVFRNTLVPKVRRNFTAYQLPDFLAL